MEFLAVLVALFACVAAIGTLAADKAHPAPPRDRGMPKSSKV